MYNPFTTCPLPNAGSPVDADYAEAVVTHSPDGPTDMRAMAVIISRVTGIVDRVKPMRSGGALNANSIDHKSKRSRRTPAVRCKVRVAAIDSGIDNGRDNRAVAGRQTPRSCYFNVGPRCTVSQPGTNWPTFSSPHNELNIGSVVDATSTGGAALSL